MIVQISIVKNELLLLKELLPIWSKYSDGFVFMLDDCTDGTNEYLQSVKDQYNILEILETCYTDTELKFETDVRGLLFETARKYSEHIICMDADEYLDGTMSKAELQTILDQSPNTVFHLKWIQYTSVNAIRIDGPWENNFKDRIGSYKDKCKFNRMQMHSTHLPIPDNQLTIDPDKLFIAHLQWLDKNHVAIKQYFWKITDYVNNKLHGIEVAGNSAYDASVNNFNWEEEYFDYPLRVREDIFTKVLNKDNYRVNIIQQQTQLHDIPNLGDWGLNIQDSIPMYFCTAADSKHYPLLINMIGSIHKHNFYDIVEIRVYDLGLEERQRRELSNMSKVVVCEVEKPNPQILELIKTSNNKESRGAFSWKPVVIKDSLDHQPYTLYLDAGTTILKPLNSLFKHICEHGYLLFDCGKSIKWQTTEYVINKQDLKSENNLWILDDNVSGVDAGFQGISRKLYDTYVLPVYESTKDINNFLDDGTCPEGFGCARQDQTLYSIQARKIGLDLKYHDRKDIECNLLVNDKEVPFHLTHNIQHISDQTAVFRSRWTLEFNLYKEHAAAIHRNYKVSVVTGIGSLAKYESFIDNYIENIQQMVDFDNTEFVIVYNEWSSKFEKLKQCTNIVFVEDIERSGVYNAWNMGILNSTAEYVTNWNIDDIRFNINNVVKRDLLQKNVGIDLAYSYYIAVLDSELDNVDLASKSHIPYPDNFHEQVLSMCMAGPDPMWRKSAHTFVGLFDKSYSIVGDWEMWVRMAKYGMKFKLIPHVLGVYVDHANTVSQSNSYELERQKKQLINQYTR